MLLRGHAAIKESQVTQKGLTRRGGRAWALRTISPRPRRRASLLWLRAAFGLMLLALAGPSAVWAEGPQDLRVQLIPILATALDQDDQPVGVVAELEVAVEDRHDDRGLSVRFQTQPGRFSPVAQVAVVAAILDVARAANMNTDSLTISLRVPYRGVTVYGTSLSAMVGLTVVALAQGDFVKPDRVVTGTITRDGHIGPVSGIGLKLQAASIEHLHLVLVPEEYDQAEADWDVPFMLHVSPVGTVRRAYQALTDSEFPQIAPTRS